MILVLAGPVHSGKTSFVRALLPELDSLGIPVGGYLSLAVGGKGRISGYDLFDLRVGRSLPFIRTEGDASWQKVGPYFLLPSGLAAAEAAILGGQPDELLIVDEVGPLELCGQGVWPALSKALGRPSFNGLLVIRESLLGAFQNRLSSGFVQVFDIRRKDVQPALVGALAGNIKA
jgi:nucleoside-triphosphatase THEP1